jgi:hypothetical protein
MLCTPEQIYHHSITKDELKLSSPAAKGCGSKLPEASVVNRLEISGVSSAPSCSWIVSAARAVMLKPLSTRP